MATTLVNGVAIASGGALGALARYAVSGVALAGWSEKFPWGTLAVNALGCLVAGLAMWYLTQRGPVDEKLRLIAVVGFLGAFTTFSAFGVETLTLLREDRLGAAIGYALGSVTLCIACVAAGFALGSWMLGAR